MTSGRIAGEYVFQAELSQLSLNACPLLPVTSSRFADLLLFD
jgi:hypothetical protein